MPGWILNHYDRETGQQSTSIVVASDEKSARRIAAEGSPSLEWVRRWMDPSRSDCFPITKLDELGVDGVLVLQKIAKT